jgi:hypothetical protein
MRRVSKPNPKAHALCQPLFTFHRKTWDALGAMEWTSNLPDVMKQLIEIRNTARNAHK